MDTEGTVTPQHVPAPPPPLLDGQHSVQHTLSQVDQLMVTAPEPDLGLVGTGTGASAAVGTDDVFGSCGLVSSDDVMPGALTGVLRTDQVDHASASAAPCLDAGAADLNGIATSLEAMGAGQRAGFEEAGAATGADDPADDTSEDATAVVTPRGAGPGAAVEELAKPEMEALAIDSGAGVGLDCSIAGEMPWNGLGAGSSVATITSDAGSILDTDAAVAYGVQPHQVSEPSTPVEGSHDYRVGSCDEPSAAWRSNPATTR